MSVQKEFCKSLLECILAFNSFDFEVDKVEFINGAYQGKVVICKISVIESGTKLDLRLRVSWQDLTLELLSPVNGIISSGNHIPYFANPSQRGYINEAYDNFSERGANLLFRTLEDVINMFRIARLSPNSILTYYRIAFEKARLKNPEVKFGKLSPLSEEGIIAYKYLSQIIQNQFEFTIFCTQDLLTSFQNIINNNYEIFEIGLN